MNKGLTRRLVGMVVAITAFVPAVVSFVKDMPKGAISAIGGLFHPLWLWRWVWTWMPSIPFPISSRADVIHALPGVVAASCVIIGLGVAFGKSPPSKKRRWEDEP